MSTSIDVAIIGAGPAGIAAASVLAEQGVSILVIDDQAEPGGQIYRAVESVSLHNRDRFALLGPDYAYGRDLVRRFRSSKAQFWPGSTVWHVAPDRQLWISRTGGSTTIRPKHLILATGAIERPVPVPGWTLPGVMTAGAVQILLKSSGLVIENGLVLAGSGPLLYQLAAQYLKAGCKLQAFIETGGSGNLLRALPHLPKALTGAGPSYLRKGIGLKTALRHSGTAIFTGATDIRISGDDSLRSISFLSNKRTHKIRASVIALHQGVIPNQQVSRLIGCDHVWDDKQFSFRPVVDEWWNSSAENVQIVGDGAGIGGARAAEHAGRIAAFDTLRGLGRITQVDRDRFSAQDRRALAAHLAIRPFIDALYPLGTELSQPADDTVVCRCEEVTAGDVRRIVAQECSDPDQVKSFLRCGMGPCQGRMCGPTVSHIIADALSCSVSDVGYYRIRPPLKPLQLFELAKLAEDEVST